MIPQQRFREFGEDKMVEMDNGVCFYTIMRHQQLWITPDGEEWIDIEFEKPPTK